MNCAHFSRRFGNSTRVWISWLRARASRCKVERQRATFCTSEEHHSSTVLLHSAGAQRQKLLKIMSAHSPGLNLDPVTILYLLIHWGTGEPIYPEKLSVEKSWKQNATSEIYAKRKRLNLRNKASLVLLQKVKNITGKGASLSELKWQKLCHS